MRIFDLFVDVASTSYHATLKIYNSLDNLILHVPRIFKIFWKMCCSLVVASERCRCEEAKKKEYAKACHNHVTEGFWSM